MTTTQPNYVEQVRAELAGLLPTCDPALLDLYTLLALEFGTHTDAVMVHNAWAVYRNRTDPGHRSLIPFPYLASEVQDLDEPYVSAIHAAVTAAYEATVARADGGRA